MAIPTGGRRNAGDGGSGVTELAARLSALLREPIGFAVFSAGSTLGLNVEAALRPPQTCAKESNVEAALRPLFTLRRGYVS